MHQTMPGFDMFITDDSRYGVDVLRVVFQLGNVCTNNCSYCPAGCKDGSWPWPDIQQAKDIITKIHDVYTKPPYNKREIIWELLGGEVTVWADVEQLFSHIKLHAGVTTLVTNGARSPRWWALMSPYLASIVYSFHPEHDSYEHCIDVLDCLTEHDVPTSVLVLMMADRWDYCVSVFERLRQNARCNLLTTRTITQIDPTENAAHQMRDYTEAQLAYCRDNSVVTPINSARLTSHTMSRSYWYDSKHDRHQNMSPEWAINAKYNNWLGWDCYVGIDTLYLEQNGDVRRDAMCRVSPPLGNWKHRVDDITWPVSPVPCPFDRCFCTHDIRARKILA